MPATFTETVQGGGLVKFETSSGTLCAEFFPAEQDLIIYAQHNGQEVPVRVKFVDSKGKADQSVAVEIDTIGTA